MREPYETLLGSYRDHWLIGRYLTGDVPNWEGLRGDEQLPSLSDGESIILRVAWAFWNGSGDVRISDLARLDNEHRGRVAMALLLTA